MKIDFSTISRDATSGFLVFLIALPLCLGIAMASGFPPVAGILSAVVGGLFASPLGSARLTIKGPAAGLIVIALGAVHELGGGDPMLGYKRALAVGVLAAVVQIVIALVRLGSLAAIMPPNVVHGMLAAIGVIIIAKQTPVMLGVMHAHGEPLEMLMHLPRFVMAANPMVAGVGVVALLILVGWPHIPERHLRAIPAPMLVLALAIPTAMWMAFNTPHAYAVGGERFHVGPDLLVNLPANLLDAITLPDFSVITSAVSLKYVFMFAIVGIIESLLSVIAVDAMDPAKHSSDLNRDLLVTGAANLLSAFIGGLPMISEIVRSRANIDAGAKTSKSNFFHGLFLLIFVAAFPGLLHQIPLAALAAMLVVVGVRLASPKEFQHAWKIGADQFALFFTTFAVTLATDLLIGVAAGIVLNVAQLVIRGAKPSQLFRSPVPGVTEIKDGVATLKLTGAATFMNLLPLQKSLREAAKPGVERVRVDFSAATLVDHTVLQKLDVAANEWPNATLELVGLEGLHPVSSHPHASRTRSA